MDIKKTLAQILLILVVGTSAVFPVVSFASSGGTPWSTPSLWPTGFWGPIVWCTGDYLTNTPTNPNQNNQVAMPTGGQPAACTNLCDLIETFINIIYLAISIAIFIITPIMVVWGGIMIMFSGANPGTLETGKKILLGTVIGLVIVLCSYLLINTVLYVLNVTAIGGFNTNPGTCQTQ
ncbi:MAG TPA: hypothetical protein VMR99_02965 [Candidatus Paceibacterota bacterium]|nr:hypothetical protein [Candidatus Paceibacterota bacterium]